MPIKYKALLNVDLGEAFGNYKCGPDDELVPLIDQANIACGFHASDPLIMMNTVRLCKEHNGFGRREMKLSPEELTAMVIYQVGALKGFLDAESLPLSHVKPHGVLYGMMCRDYEVAKAVLLGIPKGVPTFGLVGTEIERAARDLGIEMWAEMYGDVMYSADGMLVIDRKKKPWKTEDVEKHVTQQLITASATATDGSTVHFDMKDYPITVCCHSDSPGALEIVTAAKAAIDKFNKDYDK
ncbi:hypothetical protein MMC14_007022 [Varicellaria rhodocarpa]|nr:hypothetical protein [Varicellaria rhodocarpa]